MNSMLAVVPIQSPARLREKLRSLILLADSLDHDCRSFSEKRTARYEETRLAERELLRLRRLADNHDVPVEQRAHAKSEIDAAQERVRMCRKDDANALADIQERSVLRGQAHKSLAQILAAIPDGSVLLAQTQGRL